MRFEKCCICKESIYQSEPYRGIGYQKLHFLFLICLKRVALFAVSSLQIYGGGSIIAKQEKHAALDVRTTFTIVLCLVEVIVGICIMIFVNVLKSFMFLAYVYWKLENCVNNHMQVEQDWQAWGA